MAQPAHLRQKAAAAQMALELAKAEIIDDPGNGARYLQTGIARTHHSCPQLEEICSTIEELMIVNNKPEIIDIEASPKQRSLFDFFAGKLRSRPTNSPPGTPRPGTSAGSLTDEESDEDCIIVAEFGPKFAQGPKGAKRVAPESPDKGQPRKKVRVTDNHETAMGMPEACQAPI